MGPKLNAFESGSVQCKIAETCLEVWDEGKLLVCLDLRPVIDGDRVELGCWTPNGASLTAPMTGRDGRVVLQRQGDWLRYAIAVPMVNMTQLTYFSDSDLYADQWRTFHIVDQDKTWDADRDICVEMATAAEKPTSPDYRGLVDPGDYPSNWMADTPPRVAAFRLRNGWMMMSVPGPLPIGAAIFRVTKRRFALDFDQVRLTCSEARIPEVFFAFHAPTAEDCLDVHAEVNKSLGFFRERSGCPEWWSQPYWGVLDEMMGLYDPKRIGTPPPEENPATPEKVAEWATRMERITGIREYLVVFDQCYFARYGEYVPIPRLGGQQGFRGLIDDLRRDGKRVGLYYHPYNLDADIPILADHPEWVAADIDAEGHPGAPATRPGMKLEMADWTHPQMREYMLDRVRYLLSDEPDCLNADWLCIHNNRAPSPRRYQFFDPDWGIGDLMTFKVWREIYEAAKRIKPDCLIRFLTTESYLQPFVDRVYINEDWSPTCDNWYSMARVVTRLNRDTLIDVTPWFLSMTKAKEFYMVMPAFGIPGTLALSFFIHPRAYLYPTRPRDHRRLSCSWQVYANAPMTVEQERKLLFDGNEVFAYRKYTNGPLSGFYASMTLSRQCYVTYGTGEARIGSTESRMVNVPLPPGAQVKAVEAVHHDGRLEQHPYELVCRDGQDFVRTHVTDCGDQVVYYRIAYRL